MGSAPDERRCRRTCSYQATLSCCCEKRLHPPPPHSLLAAAFASICGPACRAATSWARSWGSTPLHVREESRNDKCDKHLRASRHLHACSKYSYIDARDCVRSCRAHPGRKPLRTAPSPRPQPCPTPRQRGHRASRPRRRAAAAARWATPCTGLDALRGNPHRTAPALEGHTPAGGPGHEDPRRARAPRRRNHPSSKMGPPCLHWHYGAAAKAAGSTQHPRLPSAQLHTDVSDAQGSEAKEVPRKRRRDACLARSPQERLPANPRGDALPSTTHSAAPPQASQDPRPNLLQTRTTPPAEQIARRQCLHARAAKMHRRSSRNDAGPACARPNRSCLLVAHEAPPAPRHQ